MDEQLKQNIKESSTWTRFFYMVLFSILYGVAEIVIFVIVIFQFFSLLLTAKTNDRLRSLGQSLSTYVYHIVLYLTFNTNVLPYPFGAWPKGAPTKSLLSTVSNTESTDKE